MGLLESLGQFSQGATQGFGQGMDLADRYQQMQARQSARAKQKGFEDKAIQIAQDPNLRNDPIGISSALANAALDQGIPELYDKFTQASNSARKMKLEDLGHRMFAVSKVDPKAAVGLLNEMYKVYGNNNSVDFQPTPNGNRLIMDVDGKRYTKDYTQEEADRMDHDLLRMSAAYVMDPKDLGQLELEEKKTTGYLANLKSETEARNQLLPYQIASQQGGAASAFAQAQNVRADTAREAAMAPLQQEQAQAQTEMYKRQGVKSAGEILGGSMPDKSPESLDPDIPTPLSADKPFMTTFADALQSAGTSPEEGAILAQSITNMSDNQLREVASMRVDPKTATSLTLRDGTTIPFNQLVQQKIAQLVNNRLRPVSGS
jgi:hypothetical protein